MTKSTVKCLTWVGVVSGVGLIAMSASTFASPSALAAAASGSANQQVAQQQQQQQEPYIPPGQQKPQKPPQKNQQQGKPQQNQQLQQQQQHQPKPKPQQQYVKPQPNNNNQKNNQHNNNQSNYKNNNNQNNNKNQQNNNKNNNQQNGRYDWNSYQPGHRPPQWQQYRQNFDPHPYQWNRNAEHRYHWQPYNQPPGWHYQRWTYGQVLPNPFWGRSYWINSYYNFGLGDPPYGYVWVRYGGDALLVDVESGQILSVEYGVFY